MASIRITQFAGMNSAQHDTLKPQQFAKLARDVRLEDGSIYPAQGPELVKDPGTTTKSIHPIPSFGGLPAGILPLAACASVLPGSFNSCNGNPNLIVFPFMAVPYRYMVADGSSKPLYMPAPTIPLSISVASVGTPVNASRIYPDSPDQRFYTYTFVDEFGVESPPAPPSNGLMLTERSVVNISSFQAAPTGACTVRLYRTASPFKAGKDRSTGGGTSWQTVADLLTPVTSYVDSSPLSLIDMGTLLTDEDLPPPLMCQVAETDSGYLVGFEGNNLYVSDRHMPYNWPADNHFTIPETITGVVASGDEVFLTTNGVPYRAFIKAVADPEHTSVGLAPYSTPYPSVPGLTLVASDFGAMYASEAGIIGLGGGGDPIVLSKSKVSLNEWRTIIPQHAQWVGGIYYGFRADGRSFKVDMRGSSGSLVVRRRQTIQGVPDPGDFIMLSTRAIASTIDEQGAVHVVDEDKIYRLFTGKTIPYVWESKKFIAPNKILMTAAKVVGAYGAGSRLRVWAQDMLVADIRVQDGRPVRLPRAKASTEWRFRLDGAAPVYEVQLATSIRDLVGG